MAVTPDRPGPYAPASAIMEVIGRARNKGLQSPVTAEVLARSGIPESLIPRTLQALAALELVGEDGRPTETLNTLQRAPEKDFQTALAAWLQGVYADVLSFADPTSDEGAIRDAFRNYNPIGQHSRMVSLFIGLCRAAGLRTDAPPSESRPKRPRPVVPAAAPAMRRTKPPPAALQTSNTSLPQPLAGLLTSLPATGESWSKARRQQFLTTFGAVLDFCYPVTEVETDEDSVSE